MSDILPCPRGCSADHITIQGKQVRWVQCVNCGWCGPSFAKKPEAIAAWNTRAPAPSPWQGIETADRRVGSRLLAYYAADGCVYDVCWDENFDGWVSTDYTIANFEQTDFTHWMPLPPPPADGGK